MKTPFTNLDLLDIRKEYVFPAPKALIDSVTPFMTDKRDLPMIHLLFNITCIVPVSALLMFTLEFSGWLHLLGLLHVIGLAVVFLPRFILCMHYSSHRFIFNQYGPLLNNYQTHVLAPFFGIPSGMYFAHHVIMHHCEGNIFPEDLSSTEMYQRDNPLHFLHYWGKFVTATWFYLPYYAAKKGRFNEAATTLIGSILYSFAVYQLTKHNFWATFYAFMLPLVVTSFALMFGNWSQHMFLDPRDPESPYSCTYNCMNAVDNAWTFNDGYHIVHHVNSRLHWSQMPQDFMDNIQKYADRDTLVFDGLGFFDVGALVLTG